MCMKKLKFTYKSTLISIGSLFILLSLSLFTKGLMKSMKQFQVPENIINSPHYYDAILWVYIHMMVIGVLIILLGFSVSLKSHQKWISFLLLILTSIYTYLDFRTSDSFLGNSLYKGDESTIPGFISLTTNLAFLLLFIHLCRKTTQETKL